MTSQHCEDDHGYISSVDQFPVEPALIGAPSLSKEPSVNLLSTVSSFTTNADCVSLVSGGILPIVVPQTSRSLRGVHYSPFLRAYPTTLADHGIDKAEFIRFIDNLNEAFIASPFFYALTVIGSAVSFVPELAAQIVGSVIASVSELGSLGTSKLRTKSFVKAQNENLFEPHGLQIRILNTGKMLQAIHVDKEELNLPPLPENYVLDSTEENEKEDPRRRWLQALDTVIAPLEYTPSDFTEQDNWLKKAGAWTAKRQDKNQAKALNKRRGKAQKAVQAAEEEALLNQQIIKHTIENLQSNLASLSVQKADTAVAEAQRQRDVARCEAEIGMQRMMLINEEIKKNKATEKAISKVDKKEQKIVQKIRWVVITAGTSNEVADDDIDDGVEDVQSLRPFQGSDWE